MKLMVMSVMTAVTLSIPEALAQPASGRHTPSPSTAVAAAASMFRAIRLSDFGALEKALARGADVNARSDEGDTPLMHAAVLSTARCLKVLLEAGAEPNARDKRGGTALMRSVRDIKKVRLLLEYGADVNARGPLGVTALMIAAQRVGASDVVKLLLAHEGDPTTADAAGVTPLMYATNFGDLESVKALVAAGADVNGARPNGTTAVFWAANGPLDVLVWLLEHKADPNATRRSPDGRTPLMEAAFFGATANARALLDRGADVNARSARGTALMWAAGSDRAGADMIRLLLDRGADPNVVASRCARCIHEPGAEDGRTELTALMLARQRGESHIVRMLLSAGAER